MLYISGYRWKNDSDSCSEDTKNYISVNSCGYEKYMTKNINTLRKNGRPDFQIIYIENGAGCFLVDGTMQEVSKGHIILYPPGETQQYNYQYQNSTEVYWVHFTGYSAHEIVRNMGLSNTQVHFVGDHRIYIEYFTQIIRELQLKSPLFEYTVDATLMQLLTCMGRNILSTKNHGKTVIDENIKNVIEQMHTRYNYHWDIPSLAKQCNLSPDWFMHKFKNQTGMSPMEYLSGIRLEKAKWLIHNSTLSIKEISYIVGYENPLYFSKLFKKAVGISPISYRRL